MEAKKLIKLSGKLKTKNFTSCLIKNTDLIFTDLENWVIVKNQCPGMEDAVYEDRKLFLQLLCAGESTANLGSTEVEKFPLFKTEDLHYLGKLGPEDMKKIRTAQDFICSDPLRPVMNGVFFNAGELCATNAHYLYWKRMGLEFNLSFIVPFKTLELLDGEGWSISVGEKYVVFDSFYYTVVGTLIEGKYPAYQMVIPKDYLVTWKFSRKEVYSILEGLRPFVNKSTNLVAITPEGLEVTDPDRNIHIKKSYNFELSGNISDARWGANINFFLTALKGLDDEVTLKYTQPNRAMILNDERLLMPVYLGAV